MTQILIVGYGAMGGAIGDQLKKFYKVTAISPNGNADFKSVQDLPHDYMPDMVIFAVKPQIAETVIKDYVHFESAIIVSVMAGIVYEKLRHIFLKNPLVRSMPNTPSRIGKGITSLFGTGLNPAQTTMITDVFKHLGSVVWLDQENDFHITTALAGCGPAYVFNILENWIATGQEHGLDFDTSKKLVVETITGALALYQESRSDLSTLRQNVTSPNGITHAALQIMMPITNTLFCDTVNAAIARSKELEA
jgi:pyrroline-5-carboxylate reductase